MIYNTIILLGGNTSSTPQLMERALVLIKAEIGRVVRASSTYESDPWGFEADHVFVNRVVEVETEMAPVELLEHLLDIEGNLGRQRKSHVGYESRGIDLDILFIDDLILDTPQLTIPHPRLHLRRFTLEPLCEQWKEKLHPIMKKRMYELLEVCKDDGRVTKI